MAEAFKANIFESWSGELVLNYKKFAEAVAQDPPGFVRTSYVRPNYPNSSLASVENPSHFV